MFLFITNAVVCGYLISVCDLVENLIEYNARYNKRRKEKWIIIFIIWEYE